MPSPSHPDFAAALSLCSLQSQLQSEALCMKGLEMFSSRDAVQHRKLWTVQRRVRLLYPFFQYQASGAPGPAHINSWEAQEERRMRRCLSSFRQTRAVAADFVKTFRGILQYSTEMKNFYSIILDIWSINTHRFPPNSHGGVTMS